MTIRWRMALAVAVQTALLLLVVAAVLYLALQRFLVAGEERRLDDAVSLVDVRHDLEHSDGDPERAHARQRVPGRRRHARAQSGDKVVSQTAHFPKVPTDLPLGYTRVDGHQVLTRQVMSNERLVLLQVATDLGGVHEPLRAYLRALLVTLPIMMVLAAAASALTAGRLLRPMEDPRARRARSGAAAICSSRYPAPTRGTSWGAWPPRSSRRSGSSTR